VVATAPHPAVRAHGYAARFLPGLALLPTFAAVGTVALYLADWRAVDDTGTLVAVGLAVGVAAWLTVSVLFFGPFTRVETAVGDTYDQLRTRVLSLRARIEATDRDVGLAGGSNAIAFAEAVTLTDDLERELGSRTASQKWLLATGYVNLWRRVHRAEEALLQIAPREEIYVTAIRTRGQLARSRVDGGTELAASLGDVLDDGHGGASRADRDAAREKAIAALDTPDGRALLRYAEHTLHSYRNDVWDKLVNLRNRLVGTLFLTTLGTYVLLAVAVLIDAGREPVAGATVFFVVGAAVGLFRDLYATSMRRTGMVFDYGLGYARLMTIPVLSGIAALGGVALTRLGGAASGAIPTLSEIYSLDIYPYGLIVAAIFGLTPSLLLERLRTATDEYKQEIRPSEEGEPYGTPAADGQEA
jgi:hypothetical protein